MTPEMQNGYIPEYENQMSSDHQIQMYEAHLKREESGVAGCWYCGSRDHHTTDHHSSSMGIPKKMMDEMGSSGANYAGRVQGDYRRDHEDNWRGD